MYVFVSHNVAGFLWTSNLYCLYVLIKRVKLLTEKRTSKALFFSRKQRKSDERVAKVQFVIESCRLISQSNYLNNSNKDCDWHMLVCFIGD